MGEKLNCFNCKCKAKQFGSCVGKRFYYNLSLVAVQQSRLDHINTVYIPRELLDKTRLPQYEEDFVQI